MNTTGEQFQYVPPATNEEDFTMDMETYLTKLYQEQGLEVTLAATLDFLHPKREPSSPYHWVRCHGAPCLFREESDGIRQ